MAGAALKDALAEGTRRIVAAVHPRQVILFGSSAHDQRGEQSDFDLLAVVSVGAHRWRTAQGIYRSLVGVEHAADIVVVTKGDYRAYRDSPATVIPSASRHGKVLYAACLGLGSPQGWLRRARSNLALDSQPRPVEADWPTG